MEQEKPTGPNGPSFEAPGSPPEYAASRRLYRSQKDRVIAGVCGGLGHYFNVDPVLVRIGFIALALAAGVGVLVYLLLAIILPEARPEEDVAGEGTAGSSQGRLIFGGLFILIGAYLLLREIIPWFSGQIIWGVILIALGLAFVLRGTDR